MQVRFFPLYHGAAGVPTGIFPPCAARLPPGMRLVRSRRTRLHRDSLSASGARPVFRPPPPKGRPCFVRRGSSAFAGVQEARQTENRDIHVADKRGGALRPLRRVPAHFCKFPQFSANVWPGERPVEERGHLGAGADAAGAECVRRLLRPCRPLLPVGVNGTEALFARPRMGPRFSCAPLAVFAPRKARYIHYNVYPVPVYHRIPRCPLPPPARRERRAAQVCLAERTI